MDSNTSHVRLPTNGERDDGSEISSLMPDVDISEPYHGFQQHQRQSAAQSEQSKRQSSISSRHQSYADAEQYTAPWSPDSITGAPSGYFEVEPRGRSRSIRRVDFNDVTHEIPAATEHQPKGYEPIQLESGETFDEKASAPKPSLFREIIFIGLIAATNFMSLAGLGQVIVPRAIIAPDLDVTDSRYEGWFAAAYSLTAGTFVLISGRAGDILGNKRLLIWGYATLGVWSVLAGVSVYTRSQIFFDVCRAMQGFGSALMIPNALALLGRAYPKGLKKNLCFALFGAMAPWGFVIGTLFGSVFTQLVWWPWTYWSFGIVACVLSLVATLIVPPTTQFPSGAPRPKAKMDWPGSAAGVTGLVLINVAWNNGPLYGWGTPHVYVLLIVGVLALAAFFWIETRVSFPILPLNALNWTVSYTLLLLGLGWGSFSVWMWYLFRFLSDLRHLSPLTITAQCTPVLICGLLAAGFAGFLMTHAPVSFTMMVAMLAFFVSEVIAVFMPVDQIYWAQTFVSVIIIPFGMELSFPAATVILSNAMPQEHQGLAASLIVTVANYSISIALGIAGTVESAVVNGGETTSASVEHGIRVAWYTGLGLSGLGAVLGVLFFVLTMQKFMKAAAVRESNRSP